MLLPYVVLDVVEAMASLQQSIRDSVSPVVVSAARGAQRLLQPGRLQPAAFSLQLAAWLRAVTREVCRWPNTRAPNCSTRSPYQPHSFSFDLQLNRES